MNAHVTGVRRQFDGQRVREIHRDSRHRTDESTSTAETNSSASNLNDDAKRTETKIEREREGEESTHRMLRGCMKWRLVLVNLRARKQRPLSSFRWLAEDAEGSSHSDFLGLDPSFDDHGSAEPHDPEKWRIPCNPSPIRNRGPT